MRRVLLPAVLLVAATFTPAGGADTPLTTCQRRIVGAGEQLTADRRRVLAGCVAEALACEGALQGRSAASDPCLAKVARRCTAALPKIASATRRVDVAGPRCTIVGGISPEQLVSDDGLGFNELSVYCPAREVDDTDPIDLARCQRETLTCTEDAALVTLAPRAATLLAHLGIPTDDGATCLASHLCGNGEIDGSEECDDGPDNSDTAPDACRTTCVDPTCGDGVVDSDEDCDDGNLDDGDGCDSTCTLEADVCGNGVVEDGEECDDGNQDDGDGCDSTCAVEAGVCGNGTLDDAEECDDGAQNSDLLPDHCRKDCTDPVCGDGVVDLQAGELCEPPGSLLCDDSCQLRLGGLRSGARTVVDGTPEALARCEAGLVTLGSNLFVAERKMMDRCVLQIAKCVLDVAPNDPDGERTDACLTRAESRCDAMIAHRESITTRFTARIAASCPVPIDQLLGADGLDFGTAAADCTFDGSGPPTVQDVVGCAVERTQCLADNATARTVPLAYSLLSELYDPDSDFPCVTDPFSVESE